MSGIGSIFCPVCVCVRAQESSLLIQQASLKGELEGNQQQIENFKVTKHVIFQTFFNNLSNPIKTYKAIYIYIAII